MSTEPEPTEAEPTGEAASGTAPGPEDPAGAGGSVPAAAPGGSDGDGGTDASGGSGGSGDSAGSPEADDTGIDAGAAPGAAAADDAPARLSEAEAELAAQRELRERIEERKAARQAPIAAGTKLSGTAAELLAAVRAVESGQRPAAGAFPGPAPAPRRPEPPAPAPQRAPSAPAGPSADTLAAVTAVLGEGGAPAALAPAVASALGQDADQRLRADPWLLLRVDGVRPDQADGFARALLGPDPGQDDDRRSRAVAAWLLERAAVAGHTALAAPALRAELGRRGVADPDAAVQSAIAEGEVLVFQDALEPTAGGAPAGPAGQTGGQTGDEAQAPPPPEVRVLVGLERWALAEESLADQLAGLAGSPPKDEGASAADWESAADAPRGSTAALLRAVAAQGLVLHSGGEAARAEPVAVAVAARALGLRVCVAAHSAEGAAHAASLAGPETGAAGAVVTVTELLWGGRGPGRDADGTLAVDLLVVLDAPQLDVETAAALAESLPDGARLLLSGDPALLWSAGPGRVFADLLAVPELPQVVSRVPDPGPVGELVSGIAVGELAAVEAPGREVVIVPVRDAQEAVHRTVQLVADSVPRAFGLGPRETVVITPGHGGAAGTRALNAALKERLNPGPGRFGGFDPGDLAVHVPRAGQVRPGRVVGAEADGLRLECASGPVVVARERVEREVRHGWALTAHQAAGLRWPAAVVVLPGDAAEALSRPWVYTAFSRGERHLSVVQGVEGALPHAVKAVAAKPRTTRLGPLLRAQLGSATGRRDA